jgi:hypothetical protein
VDETVLEEAGGGLNEGGVRSLHGLASLAAAAVVPYYFPYSAPAPFDADSQVLVLSRVGQALLPADCVLWLAPEAQRALASAEAAAAAAASALSEGESEDAAASAPPPAPGSAAALGRTRAFLAAVRFLPFHMEPAAAAAVQADWLALRAAECASGSAAAAGGAPTHAAPAVTEALLHTWLNLARLASVSFGETVLTPERWAYVRDLESRRLQRQQEQQRRRLHLSASSGGSWPSSSPTGHPALPATPERPPCSD